MTEWIEQEDWSTVQVGDQVRVTHEGGDELKGYVEFVFNGYEENVTRFQLQVPSLEDTVTIRDSEWFLSVPAKPAVELPILPGNYRDKNGDGWRIKEKATSTLPEKWAPYTRLEEVPVTAKKVLDRVEAWAFGPNNQADEITDLLNRLRDRFGVTND